MVLDNKLSYIYVVGMTFKHVSALSLLNVSTSESKQYTLDMVLSLWGDPFLLVRVLLL